MSESRSVAPPTSVSESRCVAPPTSVSESRSVAPPTSVSESRSVAPPTSVSEFRNARQRRTSELNRRVAELARRQGGHITRAQLHAAGMGKGAIEARIKAGLLLRVHRGVYAVGHIPTSPLDRALGALLAVGPRCALFGRSAAAYWGLYARWAYPIEVISPLQVRLPTINAHRCRSLLTSDIRTVDRITVTSPARTMLDIAPRTYTKTVHRFHNELRMRKLIDNEQLIDVVQRNPRHPGARRLRALAGASSGEAKRSPLEIDWQRFATRYELPPYEMNIDVAGERIDVLFTPDRLIVELDGWGTHGTRLAFEVDRDRDSSILAQTGIPTMRITHTGLHRRPRDQVRRINAILARRDGAQAAA